MSTTTTKIFDYQWEEKLPIQINHNYSHQRKIFFSSPHLPVRWVAKIESALLRNFKSTLSLPHAEEIAYKVCKMFHWDSIPKTKVLHQFSKCPKYRNLIESLGEQARPGTFTFQHFIKGDTLPNKKAEKAVNPNLPSFSRTFLLNMILGRGDARGDNTIFNSETRELFEIDNEYIGLEQYAPHGVLNRFKSLKKKNIPDEILKTILEASLDDLAKIQTKYQSRTQKMLKHWSNEPIRTKYAGEVEKGMAAAWIKIMKNFELLQGEILSLKEKKSKISLSRLEKGIQKQLKKAEILPSD